MASLPLSALVERGRAAVDAHDWPRAHSLLRQADVAGTLGPSDRECLAEAAFWLGHLQECIHERERAYRAFVEKKDGCDAALVALHLSFHHAGRGAFAVAGGWLESAVNLLASVPECAEQGWLAWIQAHVAAEMFGDRNGAIQHAERAIEIGRVLDDRDVETLGLLTKGRALVHLGRVDEGLALLDHVMARQVSGVLGPWASAATYCGTISTCAALGDYRRAAEWIGEVHRGARDARACEFPGDCRLHRAEILLLRGDWAEAEIEAARACDELESWDNAHVAVGLYELGLLSLRRGDFGAAEHTFVQVDALGGSSQPGRAILELARGRPERAWAALRETLEAAPGDALLRARLLPTATEAALQAGDLEAARRNAEELAAIAERYPTDTQHGRAAHAGGEVASALGDFDVATRKLRDASRYWRRVGASYDEARAQVALALVSRVLGETDRADVQLHEALSTFERLGATLDVDHVFELLGKVAPQSRVLRTFMFTDIEESTALLSALGDNQWSDILRWHDSTLRRLFARFDGQEVKQRGGGDGFFVAFKTASEALDCAVAIQQAIIEGDGSPHPSLRVRIGAHEAEATRNIDDYSGRGVHEAARIAALAHGGEILVSAQTVESAGSRYEASQPRTVALKGLPDPSIVVSVHLPNSALRGGAPGA